MTLEHSPVLGKNPGLIPVSNSEMGTYKECKRKWWLSYYLGLEGKEPRFTGALALGTRVHKALEEFYKNGVMPADAYRDLITVDRMAMDALGLGTAELDKEADLGQIMLEGYLEWLEETGADSDLEVIASEKKLSAMLFDGRVEVRGKVDLQFARRTDGAHGPMDFKTAQSYDTYLKIANMAEQLKLYLLLTNMNKGEGEFVHHGKYRLLKKVKRSATAKPPFYLDYDVKHNKKTLDSYWLSLHGVISDMLDLRQKLDNGADPRHVAYPTPTKDCSWKCPFFVPCSMFDDGSAVEDFVNDNYVQVDPYARYEDKKEE